MAARRDTQRRVPTGPETPPTGKAAPTPWVPPTLTCAAVVEVQGALHAEGLLTGAAAVPVLGVHLRKVVAALLAPSGAPAHRPRPPPPGTPTPPGANLVLAVLVGHVLLEALLAAEELGAFLALEQLVPCQGRGCTRCPLARA